MKRLTLLLLLPLCSCASILQSGPDVVNLTTEPPGAAIVLDGAHIGHTPAQITVNRVADGRVELRHPDFKPVAFRLPTSVNGTIFGNIIWGWLAPIGIGVDVIAGNGSAWKSPGTIKLASGEVPGVTDKKKAKDKKSSHWK